MNYSQLTITACPKEYIDEISANIDSAEPLAITLTDNEDQPLFEDEIGSTPLWNTILITALFYPEQNLDFLIVIKKRWPQLNYRIEAVSDKEWQNNYQKDFKAQCFGNRLWITPSWDKLPAQAKNILILDPGLAFGTGSHPTTKLCLQWLALNLKPNQTLIDYGCGSGILALSAIKLGAKHVYAVDIDPQALEACKNNALKNEIITSLDINYPTCLSNKTDIVIANILFNPLLKLKKKFINLLKPNGILVLSGILTSQIKALKLDYSDHFQFIESQIINDWALIIFSLKND